MEKGGIRESNRVCDMKEEGGLFGGKKTYKGRGGTAVSEANENKAQYT